eukprot:31490-Pelagococcus_subviridis.AAC.21
MRDRSIKSGSRARGRHVTSNRSSSPPSRGPPRQPPPRPERSLERGFGPDRTAEVYNSVFPAALARFTERSIASFGDTSALLELRLRGLHLRLEPLDLLVQIRLGHGHLRLDGRLLVVVAEVDVLRAAGRAEVILRPRAEGVEVAPAVVRVARGGGRAGEVLQRRVSGHAVLLAQVLLLRAVDVGDDDGLAGLVLVPELVPRRLERLAVAAPVGGGGERRAVFWEVVSREVESSGGGFDRSIVRSDRSNDAIPEANRRVASPRRIESEISRAIATPDRRPRRRDAASSTRCRDDDRAADARRSRRAPRIHAEKRAGRDATRRRERSIRRSRRERRGARAHQGAKNFTNADFPESKTSLSKVFDVRSTAAASAPRTQSASARAT